MKKNNFFRMGFMLMIPITMGIIPFGAVVGTLCSELAVLVSLKTRSTVVTIVFGLVGLYAVVHLGGSL
jgi:hypothetical protein